MCHAPGEAPPGAPAGLGGATAAAAASVTLGGLTCTPAPGLLQSLHLSEELRQTLAVEKLLSAWGSQVRVGWVGGARAGDRGEGGGREGGARRLLTPLAHLSPPPIFHTHTHHTHTQAVPNPELLSTYLTMKLEVMAQLQRVCALPVRSPL